MKFGIGQSVTRKEDDALLRGAGRYVADHAPDGMLHAALLRSPHAHARFRIANASRARAMPGVVLVIAGALLFSQYWFSDKIALYGMGGRIVTPEQAPELHGAIDRLGNAG